MNRTLFSLIVGAMAIPALEAGAASADYTDGVFIVNEDWYGHQNSTVNFLRPDDPDGEYWEYRIIQGNNPGMELGCTNQYGVIHDGRLFLIAKQEKDPGASVTGGRITVVDAYTMKIITQLQIIDPSGAQCDGRGFVGIDSHKGYVTSSNGLWVLDLDSYEIKGQVAGSGNPNAGGDNDKPNTDPTGSLYHGQSGMAVYTAGKVFAAHQSAGLLVIDPASDAVVETIPMDIVQEGAGIGSVVLSKDGTLWLSVAPNVNGMGFTLPYLVKVDPVTLEYEIIDIPDGIYAPANSWYAWTPDGFCASSVQNALYWNGGASSWFSQSHVYRYDIDSGEFSEWLDLESLPENWNIYGCSMRMHPVTDEMYVSLFHTFQDPTYKLVRYDSEANVINEYPMISNYWFPSLPVFPVKKGGDSSADDISASDARLYPVDGGVSALGLAGNLLTVYDLSGKTVYTRTLLDDHEVITPSLPAGFYIVRAGSLTLKVRI